MDDYPAPDAIFFFGPNRPDVDVGVQDLLPALDPLEGDPASGQKAAQGLNTADDRRRETAPQAAGKPAKVKRLPCTAGRVKVVNKSPAVAESSFKMVSDH
ncbi:hypothetical protein ABZV60_35545 [Streptomyces sp. NPDC004787]|uniref:hypothetical protein n=1 Tax=Streptomyces sp. NPDC004787 TaxID=3154291 RepID=UPI0033B19F3F